MKRLEEFYEYLERRTVNQLELNEKKRGKRVFSTIHGYVKVDPIELTIIDSFFLQRLRSVFHLGLAHLVYPETRHSRFDHSIGVFHLAKEALKSFEEKGLVDECIRKNIPMAALLHDCGHFPLSHLTERTFNLNHKMRSANIVLGRDETINFLWKKNKGENSYKILREYLNDKGYEPELIARWISPSTISINNGRLKPYEDFSLICGVVDVDKMDYLSRDAFFSGTPYGFVDIKRIMQALTIIDKKGKKCLGVEEKALESVIHFIIGGELDYDAIACHHTVRIAESMLSTALLLAAEKLELEELKKFITYMGIMSDDDLLYALELISEETKDTLIGEIVRRIRYRRLFKSVQIKSVDIGATDLMRTIYDYIEDILGGDEIPGRLILYLTEQDIKEMTNINLQLKKGFVIIDFKDMPAKTSKDYETYALRKIEREFYVLKRTGETLPLTEVSFEDINPQDLLSRYIRLAASILFIGYGEDRDELETLKKDHDGLCLLLNSAVKRMLEINGKMRLVKKISL
ncbi:MAG: HD domain-containing protein [candidate division WOR-3 bacterium]